MENCFLGINGKDGLGVDKMRNYKPSERELIKYPNSEYRECILGSKLLRVYDNSAKSREEHDETIRIIRESKDLTIDEKIEEYSKVYGERGYGERRN